MMLQPAKTKRGQRQLIDQVITRQAPTRGWNARDPEAAMAPGYALTLENWWPAPNHVELRKGATNHVTGFAKALKGLMVWHGASGTPRNRLFASTDDGIYDCTSAGGLPAVASVLTNGACQSVSYTTTGGSFLFVVNGADSLRYYDGTSWTVVPSYSINGGGTLTSANISNINVFKRSLFFIEKNSMNFYYLSVDSIAGNVSRFPLGGIFSKGGYLIAMGTWTVDGGQGIDDYAAFVTSEGQIAIYKGTDPSSASTWGLQGVYDLSYPLGQKCFMKFGGDLLYLSRDGLYPIAKALLSTTVNTKVAISDTISSAFSEAAGTYGGLSSWQSVYSLSDSILIVNIPTADYTNSMQFAMNTITNAWCKITGWNAFCWAIMDNQLYMGTTNAVAKAWTGQNDFGGTITAYAKPAYDYLAGGLSKHVKMLRPILKILGQVAVDVALDVDFVDGTTYGPSVFLPPVGATFDNANWVADGASGPAVWAGDPNPKLDWLTVAANPGYVAAPRLRVIAKDATVSWSATNFAVEGGGVL